MAPDVTELLIDLREGDDDAIDKLFPIVYDEMRLIAGSQLNREYEDITIQQTELVHESFLKMVDQTRIHANDRTHFFKIAARCMRQILVDHARKKKTVKRGENFHRVDLKHVDLSRDEHAENIINIDRHLEELKQFDKRMAQVVELRFFGGFTTERVGEMLGISKKTVIRDWKHARGWLYKKIRNED